MAAFTATDWVMVATGTATGRNRRETVEGPTRIIICDISATVGATIAAAGGLIPAPTAASLGFKRNIDTINIIDENLVTDGTRFVEYLKGSHQFRIRTATALNGIASGAVSGALYIEARGW